MDCSLALTTSLYHFLKALHAVRMTSSGEAAKNP
jgi:hypothetical protein